MLPFSKYNILKYYKEITNRNKVKLLIATILGTNFGILFQQTVFQRLPLGLGWTLLSISPVISLAFAKSEGDKISFRSCIYAIASVTGVAIALC